MLCILYVNAVGALLAVVGLLVERVLPSGSPRRWVWCATIPVSLVLPGFYRFHNPWAILPLLEQQGPQTPLAGVSSAVPSALLDPAWWAHVASYDRSINRLWLIVSGLILIWALVNAMRVSHLLSVSRGRTDSRKAAIVDGVPV